MATTETPLADPLPAALWRRLAGLVYDLIAVLAIVMVVGLVCQIATGGRLVSTGTEVHIAWWYRPLQLVVVLAYFLVSWLRGGQTLGMRPWRMRLRMADGSPVRAPAALVRALVAAAPLLLLALHAAIGARLAALATLGGWVVLFVPALFDGQARALHDLLAGTRLVFRPAKATGG